MKKKILIAVDGSVHSKRAVTYVTKTTSGDKNTLYTLLTLRAWIPDILLDDSEHDSQIHTQVRELFRIKAKEADSVVGELKEMMIKEGILESQIRTIARPIQQGMAKDILTLAEEETYDAIVLARKGLTPQRDFFIGSIAEKVVEHSMQVAVWIVGEEIQPRTFLLAVDASENSLQAVKYAIEMLSPIRDMELTIFHVVPNLRHYFSVGFERENPHLQDFLHRQDEKRMQKFNDQFRQILDDRQFEPNKLRIKNKTGSLDVSTAILDEARTGRYGTLVVNRRGERGAFFSGRTCLRLTQKIQEQTIWVLP